MVNPVLATVRIWAQTQRKQEPAERSTGYPVMCSKWRMRVAKRLSNPDLDPGSHGRVWSQLAPRKQVGEIAAVAVDMVRSRRELVLENAVLRHQVNVLRRGSKRRSLRRRWHDPAGRYRFTR